MSSYNERAYKEEVDLQAVWCKTGNLSLNIGKTGEVVINFRKTRADHIPLAVSGTAEERVSSTNFPGVQLRAELSWALKVTALSEKTQRHLHFLRQLKKEQPPSTNPHHVPQRHH